MSTGGGLRGVLATALSPRTRSTRDGLRIALALIAAQGVLLAASFRTNSITYDEVFHLPAGISYWRHGQFWCYHHNPPLVRLAAGLPSFLMGVSTDDRNYRYVPQSRWPDLAFGRDFVSLHREGLRSVYLPGRSVVALLTLSGGYIVFRWSRELFGFRGGLLSLSLWVFSPIVLSNGGLITVDAGATVIGLAASYGMWRYLSAPSIGRAVACGILLGLAEAAKFTFVVIPAVWAALAILKAFADGRGARPSRLLRDGALVGVVALVVLNDVYLWEGTCRRLGDYPFRTPALVDHQGVNRFRDSALGHLPVPLPEHYVLGLDDQARDVRGSIYWKYLAGELRRPDQGGWWYYYLYALAVKTPVGSLAITGLAVAAAARGNRRGALAEASLLLPGVVLFGVVSTQVGLNSHVRYVLPALPFAFIFAGRVLSTDAGSGRGRCVLAWTLMGVSALSIVAHGDYLAYFNEAAGGPGRGYRHLAESNVDWGQGLDALRDWLDENRRGRPLGLAYYGQVDPSLLGVRYRLPPFDRPGSDPAGPPTPAPGLYVISTHFLTGLPDDAPDGSGGRLDVPPGAFSYFRQFRPIAVVAHCLNVYSIEEAGASGLAGGDSLCKASKSGGAGPLP